MEASFSHDAYKKFVESAKYAGLAENAAELQEAREAEKEEATGKTDEAQDVKETEKPEDVKPEEPNTEENSTAEEAPAQSGEAPKTDVETDVKTASPEQKEAVKAASKKSSADAPNVQLHTADLDTNPKVSVSTFEARA